MFLSSFYVPRPSLFGMRPKVPQTGVVSVVSAIVPSTSCDLRGKTVWWFRAALSSQLYFVLDIAVLFTHLAICAVKINLFANLRLSEKLKNYTFSTH